MGSERVRNKKLLKSQRMNTCFQSTEGDYLKGSEDSKNI